MSTTPVTFDPDVFMASKRLPSDILRSILSTNKGFSLVYTPENVSIVNASKDRVAQLKKHGQGDNKLEYWSPDEPGSPKFPRPSSSQGKHVLEIYSNDLQNNPSKLEDAVYGDLLHGMVKDPKFAAMRQEFTQNYTPDNAKFNAKWLKEHDSEPFAEQSLHDMYIRGRLAKNQGDEWNQPSRYSPKQLAILDRMRSYISTGTDTSSFDPDSFMAKRTAPVVSAAKATGISSAKQGDVVNVNGFGFSRPASDPSYKLDRWMESVKNDINLGTDVTGIGKLYKSMGGHGLNVGGVQDFLPKVATMAAMLYGGPATMEEGMAPAARAVSEVIPDFKSASANFEAVNKVVGQHTLPITPELSDATQRVNQLAHSGGQMPKVVSDFIDRTMNIAKNPDPINFAEGRDFYSSAASKLSPDEAMKLTKRMKGALAEWTQALGNSLNQVAEHGSVLDQYRNAMGEWRSAAKLSGIKESLIDSAKANFTRAAKVGAGTWLAKKIWGE